jgi:hypothetical protein
MNVGTAAGNVVELRTLISESSSFKCFVFKNIGWLCIELMALFLFNAQELLQVGGGAPASLQRRSMFWRTI